MRNSLRLFALLTALGAVNVYVFFFNHGTAPREILKPSSLSRAAEGPAGPLKDDAIATQNAVLAPAPPPSPATANAAPGLEPPHAPLVLAPAKALPPPRPGSVSLPKGAPGGSPGIMLQAGIVPFPPFAQSLLHPLLASTLSSSLPAPAKPVLASPAPAGPAPASSAQPLPFVRPPWSPNPPMPLPPEATSPWVNPPSSLPANQASPSPSSQSPFPPAEAGSAPKKIGPTDTLGAVLAREGFGAATPAVVAALSKVFDPRQIRAGQLYQVRSDDDGETEAFELQTSPVTRYLVEKSETGVWRASKSEQPVAIKVVEVAGSIESSLYESVQKAGETGALAGLLVELFAWDINFFTDTHPGDHWKVMVEKQFLGGQFYKYSHLLAAEYGGRPGTFRAFYWKGSYYDEKGQALAKSFLKTPLRFVRISSKFDLKRYHPILHREKAHLGVDYAAPVGTPVWASAGGKVAECEMKRGSGNTIVIKHSGGLATRYYHLSRFARGLRAGQTVRQKQVIGFVGTTGLSTGPHLHFSVTKNGGFVDPLKVQVNREAPVPDRAAFLAAVRPRVETLSALRPSAIARN